MLRNVMPAKLHDALVHYYCFGILCNPIKIFLKRILLTMLAWTWAGSVSSAADYAFVFYDEGVTAGVYDTDTLELVATPEVGANARQAVGVPDASDPTRFSKIYIINDNAVRILEPTHPFLTIGNRVLPYAVHPGERPAVLTPDARWLLVPAESTLFIFNAQSPTNSEFHRIEMGRNEDGQDRIISSVSVQPNGNHAHIAIVNSMDVYSVGLQTSKPRRLAGPIVLKEVPIAVTIAPNGAGIYAASSKSLYDIDFDTGKVRYDLQLDFDEAIPRFFDFHGGAPLNRLILTRGNRIFMPTIATFTSEYGAIPPFAVDKILAPNQDRLFLLNRAEKQIFEHVIGEKDFEALRDPRTRTALRPYAIDMEFDLGSRNLFILNEKDLFRFSADAELFGAAVPLSHVPMGFSILSTAGMTPNAIEIYGGNKQKEEHLRLLPRPIAVRAIDSNGIPVFGAEVTFSSSNSNVGFIDPPTSVTNRFGIAGTRARIPGNNEFSIQARTEGGQEAVFDFNVGPVGKGALTVLSGDFQAALENDPLPRSIQVKAVGAGVSVPPSEFTITTNNDTLTCPKTTWTGANATATFRCSVGQLRFSGFSTTTNIEIEDGRGRSLATPITIQAIKKDDSEKLLPLGPIKITKGMIRGIAGETIENAVQLRVYLPSGRAPRPFIAVEFDVENDDITPIPRIAPSDSGGLISTDLKLGCRPGRGTFTTTLSVPDLPEENFEYEIVPGPISSMDILQGNHQAGLFGELLNGPGQALLARIVDSCGNPFDNIPVAWQVDPPDAATLERQSSASNRDGKISSVVRIGSRPGDFSVIVSAVGIDGISAAFNISAFGRLPPAVGERGFVNGASFVPGWTPGSLGSIFGTNLMQSVDSVVAADAAPFPTRLRNVSVLVNETPAPILSMANVNGREQINIQVPFSTPAPADDIVVKIDNNDVSASFSGQRTHVVQPGIFEYALPAGRFAAALHADGSLVEPANPARPGDFIALFFTGGGPLDRPVPTNALGPIPVAKTMHPASVTLDGVPQATSGDFLGSFYAPALVTVYQVNFKISEDTPDGNLAVRIAQSGIQSQVSLFPVKR